MTRLAASFNQSDIAMLMRISLIVAILAAVAIGVLNFVLVKQKVDTLVTDRNFQRDGRIAAEGERDQLKVDLAKTEKDLKATQETLAATSAQRDAAVAEAEAQIKRATELQTRLTDTTRERDDAQAYLQRYKVIGYEPEQVATLAKRITDLQTAMEVTTVEKRILQRNLEKTTTELRRLLGDDAPVPLPATASGKVIVVDPKWEFVVLNFGEEQGAKKDGELLVSRNGRLVAKLVLRGIEKDRSIANVMAGWKIGEVAEGDVVIPAHPES